MKAKKLLVLTALSVVFFTRAYAETDFMKISYPNDDCVLIVSGNTEKKKNVSIRVLSLGENGEDFIKDGNLKFDITADDIKDKPGVVDYFNVVTGDENGDYIFQYKTDGVSGFYLFTVTDETGKQETQAYEYYSPNYAKEKIEILNTYIKNDDAENIRSFLNRYAEPLAADNSYYSALKENNNLPGIVDFIKEKGEVKDKNDLKERIRIYSVLESMKNYKLPEENQKIIEMLEYFTEFGLADDKLYSDTFKKTITEETRRNIIKDIAKISADSDKSFKNEIDNVILLGAVNYGAWGKVMAIVNENISLFKAGTKYLALSGEQKSNAAKALVLNAQKNAYKNFDALDDDFEKIVNSEQTIIEGNHASGNGGGGGKSSNGSSMVSAIGNVSGITDKNTNERKSAFDDLKFAEWAREAVEKLAEKNIISGKSENEFAPNDAVKREEFLAMVIRAFNLFETGAVCGFEDVPAEAWYYDAVSSAYKLGITAAMTESLFRAGKEITRQDMCTIACKAANVAGIKLKSSDLNFEDADIISDYARESVEKMSGSGIVKGMDNNRFEPLQNATRAAAAKIIYELLNLK